MRGSDKKEKKLGIIASDMLVVIFLFVYFTGKHFENIGLLVRLILGTGVGLAFVFLLITPYIGILLQGVASFFYMVFFRMLIPYEKWLDGNKIACLCVTVLLFAGFFLWHRLIIKQLDVDEQEVQCAS